MRKPLRINLQVVRKFTALYRRKMAQNGAQAQEKNPTLASSFHPPITECSALFEENLVN